MSPTALVRPEEHPRRSKNGRRDSERTRQNILDAAEAEFAHKGLAGARVDVVAEIAGANKRMIYYYYQSKEDLYLAVLERAYQTMRRAESEVLLDESDPLSAIRILVEFKFDYFSANPRIISLLTGENMHGARFLKRSTGIRKMHNSLVATLERILGSGEAAGTLKPGLDALQLYMSISALSYLYFSNRATLSAAFGRNLATEAEERIRRRHVTDVILSYVKS